MSLVSIIIPYFKKKNYIQQTINSIFKQKYKNFEILIIYDDEDQNDLPFLKKIKKRDKRIKLIINKKNIGAGMSRNKAINVSRGKYIAFLDADDLWKKDKIKSQIRFMKKNNYLITHTNYEIINAKDKQVGLMEIKEKLEYRDLIYSCDIGLSTVMIDKKLKNFLKFPNMKTKEDYVLWLKLSKKNPIYGLKKNFVSWRKNKNDLSYTIQKIKDAYTVYSKFLKFNLIKSLIFVILLSMNFIRKAFMQKL